MTTATFATREVEQAIRQWKETCSKIHGFTANGEHLITRGFAVEPSKAQNLNIKVQEENSFLGKINIIPVRDLVGDNILIGVSGPVSSRTNTPTNKREPKVDPDLSAFTYQLHKTNTDIQFTYAQLDAWRKFDDFESKMTQVSLHRMGLDRVMCGWYGEQAAAQTDLDANPQLQDLNKGWLQYMREKLPKNILSEGKTAGEVCIGEGGDYENLDHAAADLLTAIEDEGFNTEGLVCLVGRELLQQDRNRLYKAISLSPKDKKAAPEWPVDFAGIPYEACPMLPSRAFVITTLDNLSIYHQEDSWRRKVDDQPEMDRLVDYTSRNEGYVVEDPRLFVGIEFKNVKLPDGSGGWA